VGTGSRKVVWAPSAHADLDEALARRTDAANLLEDILDAPAFFLGGVKRLDTPRTVNVLELVDLEVVSSSSEVVR